MQKIGIWSLSTKTGILRRGNSETVQLEPRLAALFQVLFEKVNQMVPRNELTESIWPDTIVNEDSLTRAVSDLRKVLKENFSKPPKIETLHKRGYKLIITERELSAPSWLIAAKYAVYFCIGFILFILVLRGLNY